MPIKEPVLSKPRFAPFHGFINDDDVGKGFEHEMKAKLAAGQMPEFTYESLHLIAEGETPEADRVIAYIRSLFDKLCQKNDGKPAPPLQIFLSDQTGCLIHCFPESDKPILAVGLGLLDFLVANGFAEDHLACFLGQEKFRLRRSKIWKDLETGRPEVTIADVYGVYQAFYAGYSPKAQGEFWKLLQEHEGRGTTSTDWGELGNIFDKNPSAHNRARNCDVAVGTLQMTQRDMDKDHTPLPEEITSLLDKIRHPR